jgi:ActR/RegA family two-component response regulator
VAQTSRLIGLSTTSGATPGQAQEILQGLAKLLSETSDDKWSLDHLKNTLIQAAVKKEDGNLSAAARLLGLTRPQLTYRIKKKRKK